MMAINKKIPMERPEEIEALLPWHAAGTLSARDARRVEDALARDPALARQYAAIQEERAETIAFNGSLGAPSARAMQKLFAAIDAEPARKPAGRLRLSARVAHFFASMSPRTLVFAATLGALALLLQAGVIGAILARQQNGTFQTALLSASMDNIARTAGPQTAPRVFVRFAPDARVSDITAFLDANQAAITGSAVGMFRVQFGDKPMSRQEIAALVSRLQNEKIVQSVASAQ